MYASVWWIQLLALLVLGGIQWSAIFGAVAHFRGITYLANPSHLNASFVSVASRLSRLLGFLL